MSPQEFKTRLKLSNLRGCLQDRRQHWFDHLERMEENAWSSKCSTFIVRHSFPRGRPRKTWNEVIRSI